MKVTLKLIEVARLLISDEYREFYIFLRIQDAGEF